MKRENSWYSVYVIGPAKGPVKIGYGKNPEKRLVALQIGSHEDLGVLWSIGYLARFEALRLERALHNLFADRYVRGEWYDVPTEEISKAALARINQSIYSARALSCFDTRGHLTDSERQAIKAVGVRPMLNGNQL